MTIFSIKMGDNKKSEIVIEGLNIDVITMIACACDYEVVRKLLYTAIELDKKHDKKVGRRNNIKSNGTPTNN